MCFTSNPGSFIEGHLEDPVLIIDKDRLINPVKVIDRASVVVGIEGCMGFEDIKEDHLIIQEHLGDFERGQKLQIYGRVEAYKHSKKVEGYDYCINVINFRPI